MALLATVPWKEFWLEIGIQSCHDITLQRICRRHTLRQTGKALALDAEYGVKVCVHIIAGLSGEDGRDFLETVRWVASQPVQGVKIHNLYVAKGAALAED